ncbi:Na+/H+ antiporter [Batrachochytrium dendrobatidis]
MDTTIGHIDSSHGTWNELIPEDPGLRTAHLTYLLLGGFVGGFGLISLIVKDRLYMSEAMVATIFGIIIGPAGCNIFNPEALFPGQVNHVILEFSRLVIAIQCLVAGISLPRSFIWKERQSITMLLGPVMLYMWLMSALAIWVVCGVPWQLALIIAGCLTPTDPVLANSIVKGKFAEKHIPYHVRLLLSAESGSNDGFGAPLVFFPVYIWRMSNTGEAIGWWLVNVVIYQVVLSIVLGVIIGTLSRKALKCAESNGWIDKESILGFFIAIALVTTGALSLLGVDDVLGCFVVGAILSWDDWFNRQIEETHIQEVLDALINMSFFIVFGTLIPWHEYTAVEGVLSIWRMILVALWLVLLRRLPIVVLLSRWMPALKNQKEVFFCGWFGPIGVGALFYCMIAVIYLQIDYKPLFPIVAFMVLSSIVLHGGSVSLFEIGITRHSTWQNNRLAAQIASAMQEQQGNQGNQVVIGGLVIPSNVTPATVESRSVIEIPQSKEDQANPGRDSGQIDQDCVSERKGEGVPTGRESGATVIQSVSAMDFENTNPRSSLDIRRSINADRSMQDTIPLEENTNGGSRQPKIYTFQ